MNNLMQAVYDRWNNAGLNNSIATLYSGGKHRKSTSNPFGTPPGTDLPRAEYYIHTPPPNAKSRNSRVHQAICTIELWDDSDVDVASDVKTIHDTFLNSDEAGTNPLTMSGGTVLEVQPENMFVEKVDDKVWMGMLTIMLRYSVANTVPS